MYFDLRNLEITASQVGSVEAFDQAVSSYLGARRDALERTEKLSFTDADCVLAHALFGYLLMHSCKLDAAGRAKETLVRAKQAALHVKITRRELFHIRALEAWIQGNHVVALQCWEAILREHPKDILALRLAQFMTSYLGDSNGIRDSVARALPAWNDGVPGYGYVLGCYAYGLEEAGEYEMAERIGRQAIERNPADLWAAHAVAHVMEMDGRPRQGIAWLDDMRSYWRDCNNFVFHLSWHRCLFHLGLAEYDAVLDLYDREVRSESTDEYLDIANASSLLWRLEQAGVNVGSRWDELASRAAGHRDDHFFVFADLHYAIALAAKDAAAADDFVASCARLAQGKNGTQARVMDVVGLAVGRALLAHRRGAYADAAELLLPARRYFHCIGGSHAQRDIFDQLLIDSAIRAGNHDLARSLLAERMARRPRDPWNWRTSASISRSAGDTEGATKACAKVKEFEKQSSVGGERVSDRCSSSLRSLQP